MKAITHNIIILCFLLTSCNYNDGIQKEGKRYLNTFLYSTGLYLEKYIVHESGAGMFDTGTDYEWLLVDSLGNKLSLGVTSRSDFLDLKLYKDTLYLTYVNQERDMSDLSVIIYNYNEKETKKINLSKHGFKIVKHDIEKTINQVNELTNNMIFIKGGSLNLVSPWSEITIPENLIEVKSFYISKYEVTQELWVSIMGYNPSLFKGLDNCPVENISWYEAQEFIKKLNSKYKTKYRLPTEAEWIYASKGIINGKDDKENWMNTLDTLAWYDNNSNRTHPVGTKLPDRYGLYDMIGNVEEWCSDWYVSDYLDIDSSLYQYKIVKGGSWNSNSYECYSNQRNESHPKYGHSNKIGFRLVLDNK